MSEDRFYLIVNRNYQLFSLIGDGSFMFMKLNCVASGEHGVFALNYPAGKFIWSLLRAGIKASSIKIEKDIAFLKLKHETLKCKLRIMQSSDIEARLINTANLLVTSNDLYVSGRSVSSKLKRIPIKKNVISALINAKFNDSYVNILELKNGFIITRSRIEDTITNISINSSNIILFILSNSDVMLLNRFLCFRYGSTYGIFSVSNKITDSMRSLLSASSSATELKSLTRAKLPLPSFSDYPIIRDAMFNATVYDDMMTFSIKMQDGKVINHKSIPIKNMKIRAEFEIDQFIFNYITLFYEFRSADILMSNNELFLLFKSSRDDYLSSPMIVIKQSSRLG